MPTGSGSRAVATVSSEVSLVSRRPPGPLARYVASIWISSRPALAHQRERGLPTGRADIVIPLLQPSLVRYDEVASTQARHFHGAIVAGVHDRFIVRGTAGASAAIGVHFRAGGAQAFFGGALADLRNRTELLEDLWGPLACDLRERLQEAKAPADRLAILEKVMMAMLSRACSPDRMVLAAVQAFAKDPAAARVGAVQRASGCSAAQFIRRFEAAVGITPKRYARVLRFRSLLDRIGACSQRDRTVPHDRTVQRDWAALALDAGYVDQSHMANDFRRMSGLTPTSYQPVSPEQPTHVPVSEKICKTPADRAATLVG